MKKKIIVEQCWNPKWSEYLDQDNPDNPDNPKYLFRVLQMTNTLDVVIDQFLTPTETTILINKGIEVEVRSTKRKK